MQFRRHRLSHLLVDSGDGEGALLRGRALEDALTAETEALDGVDRASVRLTGRRAEPTVRARLALAPHADPGTVVRRLADDALSNARRSAGLERAAGGRPAAGRPAPRGAGQLTARRGS